jgi:hypothetical protein
MIERPPIQRPPEGAKIKRKVGEASSLCAFKSEVENSFSCSSSWSSRSHDISPLNQRNNIVGENRALRWQHEDGKLAVRRIIAYYVETGWDRHAGATAFKLRGGCHVSGYRTGHYAKVGDDHKAHCNPLLLLGYAQ